jgi:hypothetical protein
MPIWSPSRTIALTSFLQVKFIIKAKGAEAQFKGPGIGIVLDKLV